MTIAYYPDFIPKAAADAEFTRLWNTLDWERREGAPRREFWQNNYDLPYTYGSGNGVRTYDAKPWDHGILSIRDALNRGGTLGPWALDCCFVNGYENERDALGWHADDSPEMNPAQPVMVISYGAERDIMFRDLETKAITKQRLGHGSLLVMPPGFQQTHQHKIPKGDRPCGPRISLTYRGMIV